VKFPVGERFIYRFSRALLMDLLLLV